MYSFPFQFKSDLFLYFLLRTQICVCVLKVNAPILKVFILFLTGVMSAS
jgi:hypothetical protein